MPPPSNLCKVSLHLMKQIIQMCSTAYNEKNPKGPASTKRLTFPYVLPLFWYSSPCTASDSLRADPSTNDGLIARRSTKPTKSKHPPPSHAPFKVPTMRHRRHAPATSWRTMSASSDVIHVVICWRQQKPC